MSENSPGLFCLDAAATKPWNFVEANFRVSHLLTVNSFPENPLRLIPEFLARCSRSGVFTIELQSISSNCPLQHFFVSRHAGLGDFLLRIG